MVKWKKTRVGDSDISDKLEYYLPIPDITQEEKHYQLDEKRTDDHRLVFKKIRTGGHSYANDLIATLIDRMEMTVVELVNLQNTNTQQTKVLKKTTEELMNIIHIANEENSKIQRFVLVLTIVGTFLAFAGVIEALNIISCWFGHSICVK